MFTPTGPQPTFTPTGPQPTFTPTGAQPAFTPSTGQPDGGPGTQPVRRTPWESGDRGKAPDWDGTADDRDASPSPNSPVPNDTSDRDQTTGRDAAPAAAPPAKADKPERHSHRGGKHGRPSRWRGSGGRSGEDEES